MKLKKILLLWSNGGHLGYRTALTDTILKGDHPRIISAELGWDWHSSFRGEDFFLKHNDELFNIYYGIFYELWTFAYFDRLCKLEKRGDEIKKNSSPLKLLKKFLFLVMAAILDTRRCWRKQVWKGTTQGSFQQSLVEIGTVVSEERIQIWSV
jgi:hypothetical protein